MNDICADAAIRTFEAAWTYAHDSGLRDEVTWQHETRAEEFTERELLREAAWVILCSGFKESVVRRAFGHVSLSFCDWESSKAILESRHVCRLSALHAFNNERKINAIVGVAERVDRVGFFEFRQKCLRDPITELRRLPYIGAITVWHLAKNLGFEVAKPDRHLVRLCEWLNHESPQTLCESIAAATGNSIKVVDLVLWRFMADRQHEARAVALG